MLRHLAKACRPAYADCTTQGMVSMARYAHNGPVYVVFGATGGIGRALATRLLTQPDAEVVMCGRDETKLKTLQKALGGGEICVADPLQNKGAETAMDLAVKKFGKVNGVANCIGNLTLKSLHTTMEQEFRESFEINTMSAFQVAKASIKPMRKQKDGGSIVLFSSAVAKHGLANHEAIAAAKAGVYGLALSTAATYASNNIRVNCVAPGMTDTPLAEKISSSPPALAASVAMHPLKRIGTADEPAAAAEFLMSPSNSNITGQFFAVDGGLSSIKSK